MSHNALITRLNRTIAEGLPYRGTVLDLGCGDSPYRAEILARADAYIGVDWPESPHGLGNVDVLASLAAPLPFRDAAADTIVAFQVLEHLPEPQAFLSECRRVLRPGGFLCLTVPFMWGVHEAPHDYFRFTRYGLTHLLRRSGFAQMQIRENTGFWQTWVLKLNYHTARWLTPRTRFVLAPLWWIGQRLAPALDRWDPHPEETASYTVIATR
ncbi:MAG TPA: class I SAM-dependent methyltransferase [Longimicrobiales bacterium]|nr:class I SAM-dependent methyltransferase [Longimicrobiales bacterium]